MIPSLQSLATVAIIKDPAESKKTHAILEQATGHFKYMRVFFIDEGDPLRQLLAAFHYMQTKGNETICNNLHIRMNNRRPEFSAMLDQEFASYCISVIEAFRQSISYTEQARPIEMGLLQSFLKTLHIPLTLASDFQTNKLDEDTGELEIVDHEDLVQVETVIAKNHLPISFVQVCFDEEANDHEQALILRLINQNP